MVLGAASAWRTRGSNPTYRDGSISQRTEPIVPRAVGAGIHGVTDVVACFPMGGLQYRIGKVLDDGSVTVEVAERGRDEWHVLATHKTVEAAADQIAALNETEAEINGEHISPAEFVSAVQQVLRAAPTQAKKTRQ